VTIAIVEGGQTALAKGWGTTLVGTQQPVGPRTIFATGSTGKAFTSAALAILVDQGKIKWDDKVIDHMPDFRMWDAWVTREMTVRDLLVHRSGLGLGQGDLLFLPNSTLSHTCFGPGRPFAASTTIETPSERASLRLATGLSETK
jgi:CubicO group peptidase (beta-lactamase class C family)